jgi:hypothetical protein
VVQDPPFPIADSRLPTREGLMPGPCLVPDSYYRDENKESSLVESNEIIQEMRFFEQIPAMIIPWARI